MNKINTTDIYKTTEYSAQIKKADISYIEDSLFHVTELV